MPTILLYLFVCCIALSLNACRFLEDTEIAQDTSLYATIIANELSGDPSTGRELPSIESPKAQLGMQLFYSKALGGDMDAACVTCHHPMLGGGDALSLPIGTEAEVPDLLGPGRSHAVNGTHYDGGPTVPRNAQSIFNIALWDDALFHDGRVESLDKIPGVNGAGAIRTPDSAFNVAVPNAGPNLPAAQAGFPVTSAEEMRGHQYLAGESNAELRQALVNRLRNVSNSPVDVLPKNDWLQAFRVAFDDPQGDAQSLINFANISEAIAEYERSMVYVDSPWRAYVKGDSHAISLQAKEGALLFFGKVENGGAGCNTCHSGDLFSDQQYHNIAMIQIGRGKGDGSNGSDDFGRYRESGDAKDLYAFRTPSLLNVEVTGPWGHAGAYTSLEAVVRHHVDPMQAIREFDTTQIDPSISVDDRIINAQLALAKLNADIATGRSPVLQTTNLSDEQIDQLVAFLQTLTDPCVKSRDCLSPWIPDDSLSDPDGLRLNAIDRSGNVL